CRALRRTGQQSLFEFRLGSYRSADGQRRWSGSVERPPQNAILGEVYVLSSANKNLPVDHTVSSWVNTQYTTNLSRHVFAACVCISLASPSWARSEDSNLVVSVPVANMYSKASEDAEVVSQAIYGSPLKVLEESEGWARVRTADDYTGWVRLDAARRRSSDDHVDHASRKTVGINTQLATLYRETAVTAHRPVLSLPFETR